MAQIVLFHHVMGLGPGTIALGERLGALGHRVETPDLFNGVTFPDIPAGLAHLEAIGFETLVARAHDAVSGLGQRVVYAGLSMGVIPAIALSITRPGALGAIALESFVPPSFFGTWPEGLPLTIHGMDADPEFAGSGDLAAARDFATAHPEAELFTYPGDRHLFLDDSLPSHDPAASDAVLARLATFLARL
jgi:dienelactone hydrolase